MAASINSKSPVVLVTGCSLGGIGYALVLWYASSSCYFAWRIINLNIKGPVLDISIEDAKAAMDTNVLGVLRLAQAVFPHMASRKQGTFMTVASVSSYTLDFRIQVVPWSGLYCASKAAASSLTEALQMEARALSPDIHVIQIVAGGVK
ncbi:unnamed protein product [Rhizoctonia solani]|uniref:Uncharacterized protein n=1 Tax=Rhizoctonia solani TaxID=456999 RepID=A0A8H3DEP9_9AGAM|nr:unnamed protein product [Rhizoctonia solani]